MLQNLLMFYFKKFRSYSILFCIFMTTITWHTMLQTEASGNIVLVSAGLVSCTSSASLKVFTLYIILFIS
jgi:hypothetical protein